jgi:hypothetical protein
LHLNSDVSSLLNGVRYSGTDDVRYEHCAGRSHVDGIELGFRNARLLKRVEKAEPGRLVDAYIM